MSILAHSVRGFATAIVVLAATVAMAGDAPTLLQRTQGNDLVYGGAVGLAAKTITDTVLVVGPWGSGAPYNGQFQNPNGSASWNGWTSRDLTEPKVIHWNVNDFGFDASMTYAPINGNYSAWCGSETTAARSTGPWWAST